MLQKRAEIWGHFWLCWCGWQTVWALLIKIVPTTSERAIWVYDVCRFPDQKRKFRLMGCCCGTSVSGEFIAMENTDMSAVKRSRTRRLLRLSGLVWLLAITAAHASDNSKSTLEVFELLEEAGSRPISNTPPPPINITPKPLSTWQQVQAKVSALLQQVAAQQ